MGRLATLAACLLFSAPTLAGPPAPARLEIEPGAIILAGARDTARILVTAHFADGTIRDLTREAALSTSNPTILAVEPGGRLLPRGDGTAEVIAQYSGLEARAPIQVRDAAQPPPIGFTHEVLPALSKAGCNAGACHGTPTGKNGFRLSLRGYDPKLDSMTLAREADARRANRIEPDSSLLLLKGTGQVEHGGGRRMEVDGLPYRVLRTWIAEGLRPDPDSAAPLASLDVWPRERILDAPADSQQIVVRARFADGSTRDVTDLARFTSTDDAVATVEESGLVRKLRRGEATIMVAFESLIATAHLVFREPVPGLAWTDPPATNFIDEHVFAKLKLVQIAPSGLADDATFLRRVRFDLTGLPPAPDEIRAFLADPSPGKRSRKIDELLEGPDYVDFWALKWADRLGCNQRFVGHKGAFSYHRWIRDQVGGNVPFDRFARAIVTAKGSNYTHPPASFYRRLRNPEEAVETVSQLFLGVRLQCAKCHNHVSERWTQDDYYGMAAFFSQVRFKNGPQFFELYDKEETVFLKPDTETRQPRTGEKMRPRPLGAEPPDVPPGADRREALADWLTSPDNPFFARAAVNRIWYHLFGRGIVDPVDDLRDSNPPASAELLQALADDFVAHRFDVKHTIRTIANSRTYQLTSTPNPWNADDGRYFSHALVRLLGAEQLLDAASHATGIDEKLFHLPPGTRAAQVPDGEFNHPFLKAFGQPARAEACECERGTDSTLDQALQLVGGRTIHAKLINPDNRIGRLLAAGASDAAIAEDLFLATLGRPPTKDETRLATARLAGAPDRRQAAEDLLWSLLNHPEFLFQH